MPYSSFVEHPVTPEPIRYIALDRKQLSWGAVDLEGLVEPDHPVRVIWELSGRFQLQSFEAGCKSREGNAGRPCWPAQLLVSIWMYSYSMGVASARAIERMMAYEPGLRWLTADQEVNHHSLSDFRVGHQEALDELFAQMLAMLETAGVVNLKRLLQDGTKVRAVAGSSSMHRRKTLEKRLREGRRVIRKLDEEAKNEEGMDARKQAAQQRAAREAVERATAALEKLKKLEEKTKEKEKKELRVSESEAEARKMKHADGSWAPSYNVQITTEEQSRMVVSVDVSSDANDTQQLLPAIERVNQMTGARPEQIIADNGYATRKNVEGTAVQGIELIAPWKEDKSREAGACRRNGIGEAFVPSAFGMKRGGKSMECPAGKQLVRIGERVHHGVVKEIYQAEARECGRCRYRKECCGARSGPRRLERVKETGAMRAYLGRMKQRVVKAVYSKRSEIAEFPHLWAKGVKKWRRFSVRGMVKARMEAVWVALAYNVTQWMRVRPTGNIAEAA